MNDKIKELAEQADCSIDGMGYGEGNIEAFAELIVRECMRVARSQRDPTTLNYKPSELFARDLQLHFGIKDAPGK